MSNNAISHLEIKFSLTAGDIAGLLRNHPQSIERDKEIKEFFAQLKDTHTELEEYGYNYTPWLEKIYRKIERAGVLR